MSEINIESKYLKSHQQYSDLYDRFTVEECRRIESRDRITPKDDKSNLSDDEKKRVAIMADNFFIYFTKGERYANKEETIRKWMDRDKERDEIYESAQAPENITCLTCGRLMFVESKHFWLGSGDKDRVLFFYDCPLKHLPRRAFYSDGEEWKSKPNPCPKCGNELERTTEKKVKNKIISIDTCSKCGYSKPDEYTLSTTKEKIDLNFAKDRARFCFSEKEGQEYIKGKENVMALAKFMDEVKEKEKNKESYEKVAKLEKLKIIEVEKRIGPVLEAEKYIKLQFGSPEMGKDVIVHFTVHDAKEDRNERQSQADLIKLLKKVLQGTNWKLMSDGVNYRLGMLSGRLRGYEREEDLLELVNPKKKQKNSE